MYCFRLQAAHKSLLFWLLRLLLYLIITLSVYLSIELALNSDTNITLLPKDATGLRSYKRWVERPETIQTDTSKRNDSHSDAGFRNDTARVENKCNIVFTSKSLNAKEIYDLKPGELSQIPPIDFIPKLRNPCFYVRHAPASDGYA